MVKDPVCGMEIDETKVQLKSEYEGKVYYFCSQQCKDQFEDVPQGYVGKEE